MNISFHINIHCGSKFQEQVITEIMRNTLKAIGESFENHHKKNEFSSTERYHY